MTEFEGVPRAIAKLGRRRQWQQAVSLIEELRTRSGDEPSEVAALGAVIGACAKGLQWELALHFLAEQVASCSSSPSSGTGIGTGEVSGRRPCPSVVSFNAAVGACGKTGQWERALDLVADMHRLHISPNSITTKAVLRAVSDIPGSSAWHAALERLQAMAFSSKGPARAGNGAQHAEGNGAAGNGAQHVVAHVRLQECNGAAEMRISAASRASSGHWQLHQSKAQGSEESPPPATSFFPKSASCASASASAVQGEGLRFANLQSPLPLPLLRQEVEKGRTGGPPHRPPTPLHQPQLQFQLRQPEGSPFLGGGEREGDEAETETTAEAPSQPSTSSSPPASASGVGVMNPEDAELLSVLWTCQAAGLWQEALAVLRSLEAVASLPSARPALSSETAETAAPQRFLTETYTAVMSACEASGEWALALSLLSDALHAQGGSLVPSAMSDIIMSAFAQGEKWQD
ncbi:unnamed protein product, partial [Polarella glacialis]